MLPTYFVEQHLKDSDLCSFMGHKLRDLTYDELLAVAICGWKMEQDVRNDLTTKLNRLLDSE